VVSVLCFTSELEYQVMRHSAELGGTIEKIAASGDRSTMLVFAGNTFDLRTSRPESYWDADGAISKLQRIVTATAFGPILAALRAYLSRSSHSLALVLGDREAELALPHVGDWLLDALCGGDAGARSRIVTAFFGTGLRTRVGGRSVLCLHGHDVDPWNTLDYDALMKAARAVELGRPPSPPSPSGGASVLVDVLCPLRAKHPFLTLLQPADDKLLMACVAVEPAVIRQVRTIAQRNLRALGARPSSLL
jgi:hypothetical protein